MDDGSDDMLTLELLRKYVSEDERIRLYQLKKRGAASARNSGMLEAEGKYIVFLDADDYFEKNMLEMLLHSIESANAEMCICNYSTFVDEADNKEKRVNIRKAKGITDRCFRLSELPENGLMFWNLAPWNKMYERRFLIDNHIMFQELSSSNDVFFSVSCAALAERIVYCTYEESLIHYRTGSKLQISSNRNPMDYHSACLRLRDLEYMIKDECIRKQFYALWLVGLASEIKTSKKTREGSIAYDQLRGILEHDGIKDGYFSSKKHNRYLWYYLNEHDPDWIHLIGNYESQLDINKDSLLEEITPFLDKRVVLWGYGKRGQAFEDFWNSWIGGRLFITDSNKELVGRISRLNNVIIPVEEAISEFDVIITSNDLVKDNLATIEKTVISIEKFCEL